jgi:hypothetical protein
MSDGNEENAGGIEALNLSNLQMVGTRDGQIVVLMPRTRMSKQEALVHAAWLVALATGDIGEFHQIVKAIAAL